MNTLLDSDGEASRFVRVSGGLAVLLLGLSVAWGGMAAQSGCAPKPSVEALLQSAYGLVFDDAASSRQWQPQLDQALAAFRASQQRHGADAVHTLYRTLRGIHDRGVFTDREGLRRRLGKAERMLRAECESRSVLGGKDRQHDVSYTQRGRTGPGTGHRRWFQESALLRGGSYLAAIMAASVGSIFLLRQAYLVGFALINNRKRCRIPAAVESGLDVIDGFVTILGRHGCRFEAINEGARQRLLTSSKNHVCHVLMHHHRLAASINGFADGRAMIFFDQRIGVDLLWELHGLSLVATTIHTKAIPSAD